MNSWNQEESPSIYWVFWDQCFRLVVYLQLFFKKMFLEVIVSGLVIYLHLFPFSKQIMLDFKLDFLKFRVNCCIFENGTTAFNEGHRKYVKVVCRLVCLSCVIWKHYFLYLFSSASAYRAWCWQLQAVRSSRVGS